MIGKPGLWRTLRLSVALVVAVAAANLGAARADGGLVATGSEGMVVSAERNATEAGVAVLRAGGNAVDAAVAVAYALAVTHPTAGNIGGGGFMVISMADGRATTIDYREVAPIGATADMYQLDGDVVEGRSMIGGLAAGIPGTVAGLEMARERYGTKPHRELVQDAIRLARDGHRLDEEHADDMAEVRVAMRAFPSAFAIFAKDPDPYKAGELWIQKDLAATLQTLADEGPQSFYRGDLAKRLVKGVRKVGGIWTEDDLAGYKAVERAPLRFDYRGLQVISMPPPSSGGVVLAQMLRASELTGLHELSPASTEEVHLYAEIARRMYLDRNAWLGDPDFIAIPLAGLLDEGYLKERVADIDPKRATRTSSIGPGQPPGAVATASGSESGARPTPEGDHTTHFSVLDRWGNAVSNTTTLNLEFGAKAVIPGTGILLNDQMDDFAAKPGTANAFGLVQGAKNAIAPRRRMLSSMTPSILLDRGKVRFVVGSPGGSKIITTVFQVIHHVLDHGWSMERAVTAPRVHHQSTPDEIRIEPGALRQETIAALKDRGHTVTEREPWSAAHCIEVDKTSGAATGVVDPREGGWAEGP